MRQGQARRRGSPIAAWSNPAHPRHAISVDNLLRMNSGLAIGDRSPPGHRLQRSLGLHGVRRTLTWLLSPSRCEATPARGPTPTATPCCFPGIIPRTRPVAMPRPVPPSLGAFSNWRQARHRHVTLEFGRHRHTPIGSSHMLASRPRLGTLRPVYLNDGVVGASACCQQAGSIRLAACDGERFMATPRGFGPTTRGWRRPTLPHRRGIPAGCFRAARWGSTSLSCRRGS